MINKIFIDPKLYKRLARLKRASKKALLAAKSAEEIIEEIQRGAVPLMEIGSLTRRRELRLPGCFKFNLGAGYRLITLKQHHTLYILHTGSHDECNRWIEDNRELPVEMIAQRCQVVEILPVKQTDFLKKNNSQTNDPENDPKPEYGQSLDDQILRRIFCGLTGEAG